MLQFVKQGGGVSTREVHVLVYVSDVSDAVDTTGPGPHVDLAEGKGIRVDKNESTQQVLPGPRPWPGILKRRAQETHQVDDAGYGSVDEKVLIGGEAGICDGPAQVPGNHLLPELEVLFHLRNNA